MKFKIFKKIIGSICLILVVLLSIAGIQDLFVTRSDIDKQFIPGFYEERENSLDAVYIGSSNCYAFWNSAFAFQQHGICVYPYSSNGQPFYAAKYLIQETRKTQKDAVFIVNINTVFDDTVPYDHFHFLLGGMPYSLERIQMVKHLCKMGGYSLKDSWEFYLPLVRFHSRWGEVEDEDFSKEVSSLKGATATPLYLNTINDVTAEYVTSDNIGILPELVVESTNELLDYCDEEKLKVVFVTVPQAVIDPLRIERYNALNELIRSRGYETLCLENKLDDVGINLKVDYYNGEHTNIHGSVKFTDYLSRYLIDKFGFKDKRKDADYKDWHKALEEYKWITDTRLLPYETDTAHRDYTLEMTKAKPTYVAGTNWVDISWKKVDGATGYTLYRRTEKHGNWQEIATLSDTSYRDSNIITGRAVTYYYAVAPYVEKDGERYYGDAYYKGKKAYP